jgi:hypothetical protein
VEPVVPAAVKAVRRVGVTGQGIDRRDDGAHAILVGHVAAR